MDDQKLYLIYLNSIKKKIGTKKEQQVLSADEEYSIGLNIQQSIKIKINSKDEFDFQVIDENTFNKNLTLLIHHNLLYVIREARSLTNGQLPLGDLIQEGNIGLYRAALRFDPTKGIKFISHAKWWIRQSIISAITNFPRNVQIPHNIAVNQQKINKISNNLFVKFGYVDPMLLQYGSDMPMRGNDGKLHIVKIAEDSFEGTGIVQRDINRNIVHTQFSKSMSDTVKEDSDSTLFGDTLSNTLSENDTKDNQTTAISKIEYAMKSLCDRDKDIIKSVFGIGLPFPLSKDELANKYDITKVSINNIIKHCLGIMKYHIEKFEQLDSQFI